MGESESNSGIRESNIGERECFLGESESKSGEDESNFGESECVLGETESDFNEGARDLCETESSFGETKNNFGDTARDSISSFPLKNGRQRRRRKAHELGEKIQFPRCLHIYIFSTCTHLHVFYKYMAREFAQREEPTARVCISRPFSRRN